MTVHSSRGHHSQMPQKELSPQRSVYLGDPLLLFCLGTLQQCQVHLQTSLLSVSWMDAVLESLKLRLVFGLPQDEITYL
jgi:hypothetical protein